MRKANPPTLYITVRQPYLPLRKKLSKPTDSRTPRNWKRKWPATARKAGVISNRPPASSQRLLCPTIKYMKSWPTTRWMPLNWLSRIIIRRITTNISSAWVRRKRFCYCARKTWTLSLSITNLRTMLPLLSPLTTVWKRTNIHLRISPV